MTTDTEKEIFKELCHAETAKDVFKAVDKLEGEPRTPQSEVLINGAGYLMGNALMQESQKNKNE